MLKTALALLPDDTFATIDYLDQQSDPKQVVKTYNKLITKLYWEKKDLPNVVCLAIAGIQYATSKARFYRSDNLELANELLEAAKVMSYNLASFTWMGWDEPDIVIEQAVTQIGLQAAKTNLRLTKELSNDELPLCRAHWMLGAHYLSSGLTDKAKQQFFESAGYARRAQVEAEELLAIGHSLVTTLSATTNDEAARRRLVEVQAQLEPLENGPDFIGQLNVAMKLFVSSCTAD